MKLILDYSMGKCASRCELYFGMIGSKTALLFVHRDNGTKLLNQAVDKLVTYVAENYITHLKKDLPDSICVFEHQPHVNISQQVWNNVQFEFKRSGFALFRAKHWTAYNASFREVHPSSAVYHSLLDILESDKSEIQTVSVKF